MKNIFQMYLNIHIIFYILCLSYVCFKIYLLIETKLNYLKSEIKKLKIKNKKLKIKNKK